MSLQLKLNLLITSLLLILLSVSAYFIIENAREDVRAEVSSTSNLVLHLLDAEIVHYTSDFGWINHDIDGEMTIFKLKTLGNIRHLKIEFFDARGRLRESNHSALHTEKSSAPPAWFIKMMDMSSLGVDEKRKNVVLNGRYLGDLVVTPDPSYEIAEVWSDTVGLLTLVGIFFIVMNASAYWAVRYTFKPVHFIISALTEIEQGVFGSRLPVFKQVELQQIGKKFNAMADTLEQSTHNNHRLTQQLINLQEDERKSLARDIHDEIGQYLTAIHVDASAILSAKKISTAKESANAISNVTRQMMDMVHELLQRLRPRVLDELGLGLALSEHIHHWRQRNRSVSIVQNVSGHLGVLDEAVALTAYRVVQECLTNITKHAQANRLTINVNADTKSLLIDIEDDGVGFDVTKMTNRFGLAGMRERVQGLLGDLQIESTPTTGTKIHIRLPKHVVVNEECA